MRVLLTEGLLLMREITESHEVESEVGLCTDHSGGHEIESAAVFSAIESFPYLELWFFVSPNLER